MIRLILIIFLIACTTKHQYPSSPSLIDIKEKESYIVLNRPNSINYHQIEYIGNWVHMAKGGSYAQLQTDTARYTFWGYGVEVRTELMKYHKAYQILIDGNFIETVNVKDSVNTANNLTYSNMELETGNHVLELVPEGGNFVLNSLTIHYFVDPTPDDIIHDTIYIDKYYLLKPIFLYDTILIN